MYTFLFRPKYNIILQHNCARAVLLCSIITPHNRHLNKIYNLVVSRPMKSYLQEHNRTLQTVYCFISLRGSSWNFIHYGSFVPWRAEVLKVRSCLHRAMTHVRTITRASSTGLDCLNASYKDKSGSVSHESRCVSLGDFTSFRIISHLSHNISPITARHFLYYRYSTIDSLRFPTASS